MENFSGFCQAFLLLLSAAAFGAIPSITNVTGTIAAGQTLTITGTKMVQDDKTNWIDATFSSPHVAFKTGTSYGFEGASPAADGFCTAGKCGGNYDASVKLMGNKSYKFSVSGVSCATGESCPPVNGYIGDYSAFSLFTNSFYGRTYFRYTNTSGVWPTVALKFIDIMGQSSNAYIQPVVSGSLPSSFLVNTSGTNAYGNIPGGALKLDRWYALEWQYQSGGNINAWIDNQQIVANKAMSSVTQNYFSFGIVNTFRTPSNFALTVRLDAMTLSTSRIYPASVIEIGNGPDYAIAAKKYQDPVYLSDGSVQIKADLSGLGSGPYYLWVTNNQRQRSTAYNLSGGSGIFDANVGSAKGLKLSCVAKSAGVDFGVGLAKAGDFILKVSDVNGCERWRCNQRGASIGMHQIPWNNKHRINGMYFAVLSQGEKQVRRKFLAMR
jgi:hypothetical protein